MHIFRIGRNDLGPPQEIVGIRDLTPEEERNFTSAITVVAQFRRWAFSYSIAEANFKEIVACLNGLEDVDHVSSKAFGDLLYIGINRRLFNYLATARLYVDHTETKLKRTFGKESQEVKAFKKRCGHEYDNVFAYRFFYGLRNYAQHVGMPVSHMRMSSRLIEVDGEEQSENKATPAFAPQGLLQDDRWKEPVRTELGQMSGYLQIEPLVHEFQAALGRIHDQAIHSFRAPLQNAGEIFATLAAGIADKEHSVAVGELEELPDGDYHLRYESLPFEVLKSAGLTRFRIRQR